MIEIDQIKFNRQLIDWYHKNKRDLPWRVNQEPYRIWISEIMLQQTQVITVIPYYNRFMTLFPTIKDLANADLEQVLKAWEGLGYYSRARNIHHAAKTIMNEFNGIFPIDYEDILSLKGIGSYTAGAISSIAYNQPHPSVDGNVMRVMSRVLDIWDDIALPKTKKLFEEVIGDIISKEDPSAFNQGLMELGALICRPKSPLCLECPVREHCEAYQNGYDDQLPVKMNKTKQVKIPYVTCFVENDHQQFLLRKRPDKGLLAGLWEFVQIEGTEFTDLEEHLLYHYDVHIKDGQYLGNEQHIFSHRIWLMEIYHCKLKQIKKLPQSYQWMRLDQLEEVPISTAHKKLIAFIKN